MILVAPLCCRRCALSRASQAESRIRKGANIITRTILAITAVSAASMPIERPAATTWATSCTVAPMYTPQVPGSRGSSPQSWSSWNSAG